MTSVGRFSTFPILITALVYLGRFHPTNQFFFSLAGLFLVALASNATPFFGASYTLIATIELISFGFSVEAFVLVVGMTAAGAAAGKLVIYAGAKGFQRQLSRNNNVKILSQWLQHRWFLWAVFVAAVVPLLPLDDYLYIGAGASKTRLLPMVSVTVAAKLVKSSVEIGLEFFGIVNITRFARHYLGISSFEFSVLLTIAFIIVGVFLFSYDWGHYLLRASNSPAATEGTSQSGVQPS